MEFNNNKLERTSKVINYTIAIVLCGFLVSLSSQFIDDIGAWKKQPTIETFKDANLLKKKVSEIAEIQSKIAVKSEKKVAVQNTLKAVNSNYKNAKESFDNWIAARKTIGSPKEDKEVLARANSLDEYYVTKQKWRNELSEIDKEINKLYNSQRSINKEISLENKRATKMQAMAIQQHELKVFLIRLLIILPILLLGIYFIVKFRKHKYWPLFLGFVLFSFYSFFFGLVPYLPSYGGYVRYTVGIILSIVLGIYAINKIRAFIERKKNELKVPTTERAKKVQTETAERALNNHMCPSCGKDFIIKKWNSIIGKKDAPDAYGKVTNFCRFCGLELFKKCIKCTTSNFAHLPYCYNCGDSLSKEKL